MFGMKAQLMNRHELLMMPVQESDLAKRRILESMACDFDVILNPPTLPRRAMITAQSFYSRQGLRWITQSMHTLALTLSTSSV